MVGQQIRKRTYAARLHLNDNQVFKRFNFEIWSLRRDPTLSVGVVFEQDSKYENYLFNTAFIIIVPAPVANAAKTSPAI